MQPSTLVGRLHQRADAIQPQRLDRLSLRGELPRDGDGMVDAAVRVIGVDEQRGLLAERRHLRGERRPLVGSLPFDLASAPARPRT